MLEMAIREKQAKLEEQAQEIEDQSKMLRMQSKFQQLKVDVDSSAHSLSHVYQ